MDNDDARGAFFHTMNPAAVGFFKGLGADIWCIGNNHVMDAGAQGAISTREFAKNSSLKKVKEYLLRLI